MFLFLLELINCSNVESINKYWEYTHFRVQIFDLLEHISFRPHQCSPVLPVRTTTERRRTEPTSVGIIMGRGLTRTKHTHTHNYTLARIQTKIKSTGCAAAAIVPLTSWFDFWTASGGMVEMDLWGPLIVVLIANYFANVCWRTIYNDTYIKVPWCTGFVLNVLWIM